MYGKLGREADRQAELARVFELGADAGTGHPPRRGARPRWPLARGRGPAGTLRPGRSAQPGAGPGLGHRLSEGGRPRRLPRGQRGGPGPRLAGPDRCLGRHPRRVASWPSAPGASTITASRSPGSRDGWLDVPVPPPIYRPYYFPNALAGCSSAPAGSTRRSLRLNEGTAAAKEAKFQDYPTDWAYLALAHARKGNLAEARRWLDRLRTLRPASSMSFWDLQQLALLRSEAESVLFDAEFPSDPFAGPQAEMNLLDLAGRRHRNRGRHGFERPRP